MTDLTPADLRHVEQRLRKRREELLDILHAALIETRREDYLDLAGQVHDSGDAAVADLLLDIDLSGRERELQDMRDVEAALARIAEGRFGSCIECGSDIGHERLDVYPTAKRCMRCQQRLEVRRAGGTDRSPSL